MKSKVKQKFEFKGNSEELKKYLELKGIFKNNGEPVESDVKIMTV